MRQGLLWMPQNLVPPSPHPLSSGQRVSISILQGRLHYLSVNFLSGSPVHRATLLLAKALCVCAGSALPCTPRVVCCNRLNWLLVYGDENPWLIHPNLSPVWHCNTLPVSRTCTKCVSSVLSGSALATESMFSAHNIQFGWARLSLGPSVDQHISACRATRPWRCPSQSAKNQSSKTPSLLPPFPLLALTQDWFVRLGIYMVVLTRDRFFCFEKGQEDT